MNTESFQTLKQIDVVFETVESARAEEGLTTAEKRKLEQASVALRNAERSIIHKLEQELVDSLTADSKALKDLAEKIRQSSERLAAIAGAIEKAAQAVDALINIATSVMAAGLI